MDGMRRSVATNGLRLHDGMARKVTRLRISNLFGRASKINDLSALALPRAGDHSRSGQT
jgi:hypothetical protein